MYSVGAGSKRVQEAFRYLLEQLGSELDIMLGLPLADIAAVGGDRLAAGIGRMRRGDVVAVAGYDGEYGVIKLFDEDEPDASLQLGLFGKERGSLGKAGEARDDDRVHVADSFEILQEPAPTLDQHPVLESGEGEQAKAPAITAEGSQLAISAQPPYLQSLNDQQRAAVLTTDRALLIVAGPGTGKTRTLTARIAYLILEQGVVPESILAITFTNKAAGEMAGRLAGMLGEEVAGQITIKTFHAFGAMLLRQYAARLDLDRDFVILDETGRQSLLKQALPDLGKQDLDQTAEFISTVKNQMRGQETAPEASEEPPSASPAGEVLLSRFHAYQSTLRATHALDFDDLIFESVHLLETQPDVLAEIQTRYRWISVDEYQDINAAQYRMLRLLTANGANLCAIGDPDQAIYGFRGADRRYFLDFEAAYPGARRLSLSQNYRSTQLILDAASQVIAGSPGREAAALWSDFVDQVKLDVYRAPTDRAEAEFVVHQIEQMVGGTSYFSLDTGRVDGDEAPVARDFGDFAVLYRLNALSRPLVEAFETVRHSVPDDGPDALLCPVRGATGDGGAMAGRESRFHDPSGAIWGEAGNRSHEGEVGNGDCRRPGGDGRSSCRVGSGVSAATAGASPVLWRRLTGLPGNERPGQRDRRLQSPRRPGGDDDLARGQGTRIPRRVRGGLRGRAVALRTGWRSRLTWTKSGGCSTWA